MCEWVIDNGREIRILRPRSNSKIVFSVPINANGITKIYESVFSPTTSAKYQVRLESSSKNSSRRTKIILNYKSGGRR